MQDKIWKKRKRNAYHGEKVDPSDNKSTCSHTHFWFICLLNTSINFEAKQEMGDLDFQTTIDYSFNSVACEQLCLKWQALQVEAQVQEKRRGRLSCPCIEWGITYNE